MKILDQTFENNYYFQKGYNQCLEDMLEVFKQAKIINPNLDVITVITNWEKLTFACQRSSNGNTHN